MTYLRQMNLEIRGERGVGKTTALRIIQKALEAEGYKIIHLPPERSSEFLLISKKDSHKPPEPDYFNSDTKV